jgi:hypothetical protein
MLAGRMRLSNFLILLVVLGGVGIGGLYFACRGSGGDSQADPKGDDKKPVVSTPAETKPPDPAPAPAEVKPAPPAGKKLESTDDLAARDYDSEVIAWKDKTITGDKQKDVSKGKPYKIDVYRDKGAKTVNRAKVDLNRNNKFDEKYSFDIGKITLQRAPADDENYTETYHWSGTGWVKAKK